MFMNTIPVRNFYEYTTEFIPVLCAYFPRLRSNLCARDVRRPNYVALFAYRHMTVASCLTWVKHSWNSTTGINWWGSTQRERGIVHFVSHTTKWTRDASAFGWGPKRRLAPFHSILCLVFVLFASSMLRSRPGFWILCGNFAFVHLVRRYPNSPEKLAKFIATKFPSGIIAYLNCELFLWTVRLQWYD